MSSNRSLESQLRGKHAFLSPSKHSWLNYTPEQLIAAYNNRKAAILGTKFHEYAERAINLYIKQCEDGSTISMFINDAIGFAMATEVPLFYSMNCFGHADALCFRDNFLRIHDLKTGTRPASMEQLRIYAALFCLSKKIKPNDIKIELRIYQNNEIIIENPTVKTIAPIMDIIVTYDNLLNQQEMNDPNFSWSDLVTNTIFEDEV